MSAEGKCFLSRRVHNFNCNTISSSSQLQLQRHLVELTARAARLITNKFISGMSQISETDMDLVDAGLRHQAQLHFWSQLPPSRDNVVDLTRPRLVPPRRRELPARNRGIPELRVTYTQGGQQVIAPPNAHEQEVREVLADRDNRIPYTPTVQWTHRTPEFVRIGGVWHGRAELTDAEVEFILNQDTGDDITFDEHTAMIAGGLDPMDPNPEGSGPSREVLTNRLVEQRVRLCWICQFPIAPKDDFCDSCLNNE